MSDALRLSSRQFAVVLGGGAAFAVVFGLALGFAQGESPLRWAAYGAYIAGAVLIGYAFLTAAPPSGRKQAKQQLLKQEPEDPSERAFASDFVVVVLAGVTLFAAGTLLELAL